MPLPLDPYRLPDDVVPVSYRIRLDPDLATGRFDGDMEIDVDVRSPVRTVVLNAVDIDVDAPMLRGERSAGATGTVEVDEANERVALGFPDELSAGSHTIALTFHGRLSELLVGFYRSTYTDDDGTSHRLTDPEIYSFAILLLAAGSGTTWKQMGTTLTALLQRPEVLHAVRDDRQLLRAAIEESLRWMPTDPMFSRWVTEDTEFYGVRLPKGSVVHICIGAANRDPERWERPDEFDIARPLKSSLAFGGGNHICLGMHVARAEMITGINALLDRLPNLRLDPDAEPPRFVGMYERGATAIPVLFDTPGE